MYIRNNSAKSTDKCDNGIAYFVNGKMACVWNWPTISQMHSKFLSIWPSILEIREGKDSLIKFPFYSFRRHPKYLGIGKVLSSVFLVICHMLSEMFQ